VAESTRRTLAAATDRTRRLMFELRPPQGLARAVRELASQAGREADLDVEVTVPSEPLPFMVEEVAYRTVREAVSNVRRHARARRLEIHIAIAGDMLRGSVRDDGRGFDLARIGRRAHGVRLHLGIETLLERAELAGGRANVDSKPGKGTEVTFELPLSGSPVSD
jgi:signal transduction histidine kinase